MYDIMRELRFFKCFRLCKAFRHWRAVTKRIHRGRVLDQLSISLIPALPTFQPLMNRIMGKVHEIASTSLLKVSVQRGSGRPLQDSVPRNLQWSQVCTTDASVQLSQRTEKVFQLDEFLEEQRSHRADSIVPSFSQKASP